jgi:hypothetical protein
LESPKRYFDYNISVNGSAELNGARAVQVGGKYDNKFIITA